MSTEPVDKGVSLVEIEAFASWFEPEFVAGIRVCVRLNELWVLSILGVGEVIEKVDDGRFLQ